MQPEKKTMNSFAKPKIRIQVKKLRLFEFLNTIY